MFIVRLDLISTIGNRVLNGVIFHTYSVAMQGYVKENFIAGGVSSIIYFI